MRRPKPIGRAAAQKDAVNAVHAVYRIKQSYLPRPRGRAAHVYTAATPFRRQHDSAAGSIYGIRPVADQNALNVGQRTIHFWPFWL